MKSRAARIAGRIGLHALRAVWVSLMVLTPLFGFWLASSLAAYHNATQWLSLLVGLALFPILPVGWDLVFVWRMRGQPDRKRYLTRLDRLVLRTLLVNGAFLAILIGTRPATSFHALAVRGDWFLDGHHGAFAEGVRGRLLGLADRLDRRYRRGAGEYGTSDHAPDPSDVPHDDAPPPSIDPTGTTPPRDPSGWPEAETIDPVVTAMPPDVQGSIADVGRYLAEHVPGQRARVRAVHDYVIGRLTYDYEALHAIERADYAHVPSQEADAVFAAHTGVCAGYAHLAAALGEAAGLEVTYITGHVRAPLAELATVDVDDPWAASSVAVSLDGYSHAWNGAQIDGRWYLFDATWDDASPRGNVYETTYFLTPPALFALDHLPDDTAWQLVASPLSMGDFIRQPALRARIGTLGVTVRAPTRSQVTVDGAVEIVIDNPYAAELLVGIRRAGASDATSAPCTERAAGHAVTFRCGELADGEYEVDLFGAAHGARSLTHIGSVWVNSR